MSGTPPAERTAGLALALTGAVLLVFFYLLREILLPFVVAGIVAFVFSPAVERLRARSGWPRGACATLVLVVLIGLACAVGWLWAPLLSAAVRGAGRTLPAALAEVLHALFGGHRVALFGVHWSAAALAGALAGALAHILRAWLERPQNAAWLLLWSAGAAFELILTAVLLGYFLLDAPRLKRAIAWLVPPGQRAVLYPAARAFAPLARRYFIGVALVALYAASFAEIGLGAVLGLRHAAVLALLTGLGEFIPFVGPTCALIVTALSVLAELSGARGLIAFAAYAAALRVSIDQFIGPVLLGRAAELPPVLVIFCFLGGGVIFGVPGAILAVPAALGLKVLLGALYRAQEER